MIGEGGLGNAISPFGAVVSLEIDKAKVIEGITHSISKRLTFGGSSTTEIVIDPTSFTGNMLVFLPVTFKAYGAGPINIDLYVGTNSDSDGTVLSTINRNNESPNVSQLEIRLNPTVNSVGVKTPVEFVMFSNGTPAAAIAGGSSKQDLVFVPDRTNKYMFRIINTDNSDAYGYVAMNWFEV